MSSTAAPLQGVYGKFMSHLFELKSFTSMLYQRGAPLTVPGVSEALEMICMGMGQEGCHYVLRHIPTPVVHRYASIVTERKHSPSHHHHIDLERSLDSNRSLD